MKPIEGRRTVSYSRQIAEVLSTEDFNKWLRKLKDRQGRLRILERVDRLAHGNPGDVKPVGQGISELRLTYGPGYRVYYLQDADVLILLLVGGDKSTQNQDTQKARDLADEWRAEQRRKAGDHGHE
ncbi:MAG: hypothetical protein NVSMB48_25030 [Marmoricola sp.]